jgi:hypothetical protein
LIRDGEFAVSDLGDTSLNRGSEETLQVVVVDGLGGRAGAIAGALRRAECGAQRVPIQPRPRADPSHARAGERGEIGAGTPEHVERQRDRAGHGRGLGKIGQSRDEHARGARVAVGSQPPSRLVEALVLGSDLEPVGVGAGIDEQVRHRCRDRADDGGLLLGCPERSVRLTVLEVHPGDPDLGEFSRQCRD